MNFRTRRNSPRRVVEDLAFICRREKQERYGGRSDWRRLAYEAVLTGESEALLPPLPHDRTTSASSSPDYSEVRAYD